MIFSTKTKGHCQTAQTLKPGHAWTTRQNYSSLYYFVSSSAWWTTFAFQLILKRPAVMLLQNGCTSGNSKSKYTSKSSTNRLQKSFEYFHFVSKKYIDAHSTALLFFFFFLPLFVCFGFFWWAGGGGCFFWGGACFCCWFFLFVRLICFVSFRFVFCCCINLVSEVLPDYAG